MEHLHLDPHTDPSGKASRDEALERCILAVQHGDGRARAQLEHAFAQLIHTLAEKRAPGNIAQINTLSAAGRNGLHRAALAYRTRLGPHHFRVFALGYIEKAMTRGSRGFWGRLFGS